MFGHEPLYGVTFFPHATGIDTSAVYGGLLTALVYEDESTNPKVVQVRASKAYAARLEEQGAG